MTGAGGFLGRHVLGTLEACGLPSIALVRDPAGWRRMSWTQELDRVATLTGSVTAPDTWLAEPRLERLGGVIHLAALVRHRRRGAADVYRTNVEGTLAMVRLAAARRCRMTFVSTSGTVGCFREPGASADEDAPYCEDLVARWPYYHSKVLAERAARKLAQDVGANLVIVRPPVLLGPGDHRFRSTGHLLRYLQGRLPFLIRGGIHFADVRDVATALVRAATRREVRSIYNLAGTSCGILEFFALAEEVSGVAGPRRVLPFRIAWWLATFLRPLGILPDPVVLEVASHYWSTTSRYAESDLGYATRPARETVADTVAWLRANHPALAGQRG